MNNQHMEPAPSGADIRSVDKANLADAGGISLDPAVPRALRADYILNAVENPCCFRVGSLAVKLEFSDGAPSLQEALLSLALRKKRGIVLPPQGPEALCRGGTHGAEKPE